MCVCGFFLWRMPCLPYRLHVLELVSNERLFPILSINGLRWCSPPVFVPYASNTSVAKQFVVIYSIPDIKICTWKALIEWTCTEKAITVSTFWRSPYKFVKDSFCQQSVRPVPTQMLILNGWATFKCPWMCSGTMAATLIIITQTHPSPSAHISSGPQAQSATLQMKNKRATLHRVYNGHVQCKVLSPLIFCLETLQTIHKMSHKRSFERNTVRNQRF